MRTHLTFIYSSVYPWANAVNKAYSTLCLFHSFNPFLFLPEINPIKTTYPFELKSRSKRIKKNCLDLFWNHLHFIFFCLSVSKWQCVVKTAHSAQCLFHSLNHFLFPPEKNVNDIRIIYLFKTEISIGLESRLNQDLLENHLTFIYSSVYPWAMAWTQPISFFQSLSLSSWDKTNKNNLSFQTEI